MARSIDQQIAETQSRLNKLKDRGRLSAGAGVVEHP